MRSAGTARFTTSDCTPKEPLAARPWPAACFLAANERVEEVAYVQYEAREASIREAVAASPCRLATRIIDDDFLAIRIDDERYGGAGDQKRPNFLIEIRALLSRRDDFNDPTCRGSPRWQFASARSALELDCASRGSARPVPAETQERPLEGVGQHACNRDSRQQVHR